MLPVHAPLVRNATATLATSALPRAAVRRAPAPTVTKPRRAAAVALRSLADRIAPEPSWQNG